MRTRFLALFVGTALAVGCGSESDDTEADARITYDAALPPDAAPPPDAPPMPDAAPMECEDAEDCSDGVTCTDDECIGHHCFFYANDDNCDDHQFCNGVETCDEVQDCQPGTAPTADDGISCTDPYCNEDIDAVQQIPNDDYCSDGQFCNGAETCDAVLDCQAGTAPTIDDDVDCTIDSCDEVNDKVVHAPDDDYCDDDVYCNGDELCDTQLDCQPPVARVLDDGVDCTDDSCDEDIDEVVHTPNDANCDDEQWCNGAETCDAVLDCQSGTAPVIDDGIPCTDDVCDEVNDVVVNTANDANCDDGLFCNGEETCSTDVSPETGEPRDCVSGAPPTEDDYVTCTDDVCDEDSDAFLHTANDFNCNDGDLCSRDHCDPDTGCAHPDDPMCETDCSAPVYDNGRYDFRGGFDADAGNLSIIEDFSLPSLGDTEICTIKFTVLRDIDVAGYQLVRIRIYDLGTDGLAGLGDFSTVTPDYDHVFNAGSDLEIYDTGDDVDDLDVLDYVARLPLASTYTAGPNGYPDFGAGNFGLHIEFIDGNGEALWATAPETGTTECSHAWGDANPTPVDICASEGDNLPEQLAFTILGPGGPVGPEPTYGCMDTLYSPDYWCGNLNTGFFFDISATTDITIAAISTNVYDDVEDGGTAVGTPATLEVWITPTTAAGKMTSSSGWTLRGVDDGTTVTAATNSPTEFTLETPFNLPAGDYGVYLVLGGAAFVYTDGTGTYSDGYLTSVHGTSSCSSWGDLFSPRTWNGSICYWAVRE